LPIKAEAGTSNIVKEQLGRRVIHHRADGPNREAVSDGLPQIDEQNGQPLAALLDLVGRSGPADEQQQVRMLGP
jgi:hypothetical protein